MQTMNVPGEENFGFIKSYLYGFTWRWRRKFIELVANDVKSRNPKSVLDIGCGTGEILNLLTNLGIELYGIDPSPFMLKIAKERITGWQQEGSSVHLMQGNSRIIPFERTFDLIFSSLSFHHWRDRESCIPNILKRLGDIGEFVIYEYDRETMSRLRASIMRKHALSENEVRGLNFDGYRKSVEKASSMIIVRFKKG